MKGEITTPKKISMLYFGRKAPKGWREVCAVHPGKGFWMLRIEKVIEL